MERLVLQIIDYKSYLWYRPESLAGRVDRGLVRDRLIIMYE
jgi:hypothetical protein